MSMTTPQTTAQATTRSRWVWRIALFFVLLIIGELYVKWYPYYNKAFVAAAKHSIGASIVSGHQAAAPSPSFATAWKYAQSYFLAVWQAVILGIVVGSAVQTLIPPEWITKLFAGRPARSVLTASAVALPGMMCTCCTAPVVAGLRKRQASVGAALAYFMGNPVLNPATIVFIGFVLGWKFAVTRILFGLLLVLGVGLVANLAFPEPSSPGSAHALPEHSTDQEQRPWPQRFFMQMGKMSLSVMPVYILLVLAVGAARAWLFPTVALGNTYSILWVLGMAFAGTLFVIPTAGEVPIIQTMMQYGLGLGPAFALLMTLPTISAPSVAMVWRQFPKRALLLATSATFLAGVIAGLVGMAL